MKISLYFAQSLTKAPPRLIASIERFRQRVKKRHPEWELLEFFGLGPSPNDGKIAKFDIIRLLRARLVVAFIEGESAGRDIEIGIRLALGLPILIVAHKNWVRSRMVTGPAELWPKFVKFRRYRRINEVEGMIVAAIKRFGFKDFYAPSVYVAPHLQELYKKAVRKCLVGPGPGRIGYITDPDTKELKLVFG